MELHETLEEIQKHLTTIIKQINSKVPNDEPFGTAHNNWSFPGLTRSELIEEAQSIIDLIENQGSDELGGNESRILSYVQRLKHLQSQTVPQIWGNAGQAVPTFLFTLQGLKRALQTALTRDLQAESSTALREMAKKIRSMESRLKGLEPRTESIETLVDRIEEAYNSADQLPTDLETLKEARECHRRSNNDPLTPT